MICGYHHQYYYCSSSNSGGGSSGVGSRSGSIFLIHFTVKYSPSNFSTTIRQGARQWVHLSACINMYTILHEYEYQICIPACRNVYIYI